MSGMEPLLIGAALGGASSAAMGKNPIQGALLGGLGGGVLGAASGMAGAATGTGIGAGGAALPGVMGAVPASLVTPSIAGSTLGSGFSSSVMPNIAASSIGGASIPLAAGVPATFGSTLANIPSALSQGIMNNPNMAMSGLGAAQGLMAPEQQAPMPQAGPVTRGQPRQAVDFLSLLNPQQGAQRPQPISLI